MTLNTVRLEKRTAAVKAKAEVFEAVLEEEGPEGDISNVDVATEVSEARTKEYVEGIARRTPTKNDEHAPVRVPEGETSVYNHTSTSNLPS